MKQAGLDEAARLHALQLIALHGSQRAATSLGAFSGDLLTVGHADARILPLVEVPSLDGDPEEVVAGINFAIEGDLDGYLLASFTTADAQRLGQTLGVLEPGESLNELALSALGEAGNIIVSAFLASLEPLCGVVVIPSPPAVVIEMRGAIFSSAVLPVVDAGGEVMVIDAQIQPGEASHALCRMLFLPTPASWQHLYQALAQTHASTGAL